MVYTAMILDDIRKRMNESRREIHGLIPEHSNAKRLGSEVVRTKVNEEEWSVRLKENQDSMVSWKSSEGSGSRRRKLSSRSTEK